MFKGDSTRLFNKPLVQAATNINLQHIEWISPKTINEICRQKDRLFKQSNKYLYR